MQPQNPHSPDVFYVGLWVFAITTVLVLHLCGLLPAEGAIP